VSSWSERSRGYALLLVVAVVIFGLDHLTKWLVTQHLALDDSLGSSYPLSIHHVENRGAAFGFGPQFQWLYLIVAAGVSLYILLAGYRFGTGWFRQVVLGLILGGALGNASDRVINGGGVTDFVNFHFWPVFNLADSAISVGVFLLIVGYLIRKPNAA